jgi:predicted nucleic acid-binding protein
MDLPDVNVLIYVHREDAPEHDKCAERLTSLAGATAPVALSSVTLGGFLRIVTKPRIFKPATPMELALAFCRQLMARQTSVFLQPGPRHWAIMVDLIERSDVQGPHAFD